MFVKVNDVDLYYEKMGTGRPLIMVHGNSEDHTIFNEAAEVLKDHFTVYLPDSRNHGQSSVVKEDLHYETMADDYLKFMEELDLNDVVFYGFSDGGILGLLLANKTDRITRYILSGANVTPDGVKTQLKLLVKVLYFFTRDPRMKMILEEPNISKNELNKIKTKTTVVAGENDMVNETETLFIAHNVPDSKLMILPKEGHGSYIVHSTKIADLILKEIEEDQ